MRVTFLGTGTSSGVPLIGCGCRVCTSTDPRNRRRRASLYVEAGGLALLIDTPPDFREQALTFKLPRVDAVFFTHSHADHVFGFDDIRRFNTIQAGVIPAYGAPTTLAHVRAIFHYIGTEEPPGLYRPRIDFRALHGRVDLDGGVSVEALEVPHGDAPATGYLLRCGGAAVGYVPDCSAVPPEVEARLRGVDVMILDALRLRPPHPSHLTLAQSVAALGRIGARRSYLTHMGHDLEHAETQARLPAAMFVPHDGLSVEV